MATAAYGAPDAWPVRAREVVCRQPRLGSHPVTLGAPLEFWYGTREFEQPYRAETPRRKQLHTQVKRGDEDPWWPTR